MKAAELSRAIELVVLDLAGTTVSDGGLVEEAFARVWAETELLKPSATEQEVRDFAVQTMGQSKIAVLTSLTGNPETAAAANLAFEQSYAALIGDGQLAEIPGAEAAIRELKSLGLKIVFTTGFSPETRDTVLEGLGWSALADAALSPSDAGGRGRPFPDLNLTALLRTGITGVQNMAVVGDTMSDALSGYRAGAAIRAGVLTGAHDREQLLDAGASHVLDSVAELPKLISDYNESQGDK